MSDRPEDGDVVLADGGEDEPDLDESTTSAPAAGEPDPDDADGDDEVDEVDDGRTPSAPSPWRARVPTALPWVIAALAVAVAITTTVRWQQLAGEERDADQAALVAERYLRTLTNWDATGDGMTEVREELRASATAGFAEDVDELFGSTDDLATLTEFGARSEARMGEFYVQALGDDGAIVLGSAIQRITADVMDEPQVTRRFATIELVRADDGWLVDQVELLLEAVPGGGADDAAATTPTLPDEGADTEESP